MTNTLRLITNTIIIWLLILVLITNNIVIRWNQDSIESNIVLIRLQLDLLDLQNNK